MTNKELLKIVDKNGVPQTQQSVYFQVGNEHKEIVDGVLTNLGIPNKSFDLVEKAYFEGKAEIMLRGELKGEDHQSSEIRQKLFEDSVKYREELGKMLFVQHGQSLCHDEREMQSLVDQFVFDKQVGVPE